MRNKMSFAWFGINPMHFRFFADEGAAAGSGGGTAVADAGSGGDDTGLGSAFDSATDGTAGAGAAASASPAGAGSATPTGQAAVIPAAAKPAAAADPREAEFSQREQALLQQTQQFQQQSAQVQAQYQDVQNVLANPIFQKAYKAALAEVNGQGTAGAQATAVAPTGQAAPAQASAQAMDPVLRQAVEQYLQSQGLNKFGDFQKNVESRLGKVDQFFQTEAQTRITQEIDRVTNDPALKTRFPDIFDGGKKQDEVYAEATRQIYASAQQGQALPLAQAIERAAKLLSFDGLEKSLSARAKAAMTGKVSGSVAAGSLEQPGATIQAEDQGDAETMLANAWDASHK